MNHHLHESLAAYRAASSLGDSCSAPETVPSYTRAAIQRGTHNIKGVFWQAFKNKFILIIKLYACGRWIKRTSLNSVFVFLLTKKSVTWWYLFCTGNNAYKTNVRHTYFSHRQLQLTNNIYLWPRYMTTGKLYEKSPHSMSRRQH